MSFPCTRCGACCKSMGSVLAQKGGDGPYQPEIDAFPYTADEQGVCEKYTGEGCSVYANRPDLCNIATMRERYHDNMNGDDFTRMTIKACGALIASHGMDAKWNPKNIL